MTLVVARCGIPGAPAPLPTPEPTVGPLQLRVVYPPPQGDGVARGSDTAMRADSLYAIQSVDSAFIFGSAGRGDARVTVNGRPVPVYPTGAWLAWLSLPDDSLARFRIVAVADRDTARATFVALIARPFVPPAMPAWVDTTAFVPAGDRWVRPGEGYPLRVRAAPGARVRAILGSGDTLGFEPAPGVAPASRGQVAFSTTGLPRGSLRTDRYVAWHVGRFGPNPGHVLSPDWKALEEDPDWVWLEVIDGRDTTRARWPLRVGVVEDRVPPLVMVDDDTARTGATDGVLPGRPVPFGPYHWFFPNGTVVPVSGRWNSQIRLQLSHRSVAWVNATDVLPLRPGTPPPGGIARSMRLIPDAQSVTLRVPLPQRIPYRVDETERAVVLRLYGVAAAMDWIQYGGTDPFVRLISFAQPMEDEVEVTIELADAVWGHRTRWEGNNLLLQIRRPPSIDRSQPLRGRRIAVDAGHPPAGARGPTGITEAEVTLGVSRKLRALLEERGAEVVMIRDADSSVGLIERTAAAERADAELLVSLHANALPDGVNPFVNGGTSVYYYHPHSIELARLVNRALVRQFGFPDLGVGRGDLHLVRPTWMPAVLTEGLFLMIPEQEAVLASEEGQWRYARGVLEGIEGFLGARATQRPGTR